MSDLIKCTRCGLVRMGEKTNLFCPNCDTSKITPIYIISTLREWINHNKIFINASSKQCVRIDKILDFIHLLEKKL